MTKFKPKDYVTLLSGGGEFPLRNFENGKTYLVEEVDFKHAIHKDATIRITNGKKEPYNIKEGFARHDQLKLSKKQPTPNFLDRIIALEKKVKYLEDVVDELTKPKEVNLSTLAAEAIDRQIKQDLLTNNQKRKAIIEKAKKFVENSLQRNYTRLQGYNPSIWLSSEDDLFAINHKVEFVVNAEKRTVVALIKFLESGRLVYKGIAKCHPHEVFNEHIGKAIALGRALGLDVSEFEQAVQPDEVVEGMDVRVIGNTLDTRIIANVAKVDINTNTLEYAQINGATILNDTDAVY